MCRRIYQKKEQSEAVNIKTINAIAKSIRTKIKYIELFGLHEFRLVSMLLLTQFSINSSLDRVLIMFHCIFEYLKFTEAILVVIIG